MAFNFLILILLICILSTISIHITDDDDDEIKCTAKSETDCLKKFGQCSCKHVCRKRVKMFKKKICVYHEYACSILED